MILIIGLGNPGKEYEKTRHNIGFVFAEKFAQKVEAGEWNVEKRLKAEIVKGQIENQNLIIAKPQTYMNLSGDSVEAITKYYKLVLEKIVVISDDYNLEPGQARMRYAGEAGGHNGLKSIIDKIGPDFWRIRIGIGAPKANIKAEDYVLGKISPSDHKKIMPAVDKSVDLLIESISALKFENKTINLM